MSQDDLATVINDNEDLPSADALAPPAAAPVFRTATGRYHDPHTNKIVSPPPAVISAAAPTRQTPPPEVEPVAPAPPSPLAQLAARLGISQRTIDAVGEAGLPAIIEDFYAQKERLSALPQRGPVPPGPVPAPQPEPEENIWGFSAEGKPLSEADYEPLPARLIKENAEFKRQGKKNQQLLETIAGRLERDERSRHEQLLDSEFDRAFGNYPGIFGKGTTNSLQNGDPYSQGLALRKQVKQLCVELNLKGGGAGDPYQDAMRIIAQTGWVPQVPKPRISQEQFDASAVGAPVQRRGTENLSERDQRIAAKAQEFRENGVYVPAFNPGEDKDDLPD